MGLFDMFKKVTFDEAVNMVLTNTVPADEKGFNRFFKPISESSTAKMDAVVMLKFYRGYKGTDEEKAEKAFNFLSGKLLGEKGLLKGEIEDIDPQDINFFNFMLKTETTDGIIYGKICFDYCNTHIQNADNEMKRYMLEYLVYAYIHGIATEKNTAKAGELLGELSSSLDMNEENAAHSKAKIHILEQMLSMAEKA